MLGRLSVITRNFVTSAARQCHHGPVEPGTNLPFDTSNRFKLTAMFIVYFGSGLALPFLMVRHQLLKK